MSNFLDSTGLSRLVENIKNKFQPKRLHCELWDDGGDWTITFRDTMEEAVIETEYAKIFDRIKNNENNLIFDVLSNGIEVINDHYNVDYEINYSSNTRIIIIFNFIDSHVDYDTEYNNPIKISLDIDKDENCAQIFIFKGEEHTNITQLSKVNYIKTNGDGTKFLSDKGEYKNIKDTYYIFNFTNGEYYKCQGSDVIDEYDLDNKTDIIRLFNSLKADIGKPTFARVITDDIDGYSNNGFSNVTIEKNGEKSLFVTFNIVDFYADGTDTDNMVLAKKTMDINAEDGYCDIFTSHVTGLRTDGNGAYILNDKGGYSINDVLIDYIIEDSEINLLDPENNSVYDSFVIGSNDDFKGFYNIFYKIVNTGAVIRFRLVYKNNTYIVIPKINYDDDCYSIICIFTYSNTLDDEDIYMCKCGFEISKDYGGINYAVQEIKISLNKLSLIDYLDESGDGDKFLADDGSYVNTSKLITFEAENGSLDTKQKEDIYEGYYRNLPIYILYSGIKMLVNGIQKLGDIYSLSCSHEGVVYSVTIDTAEMSYNVITNV